MSDFENIPTDLEHFLDGCVIWGFQVKVESTNNQYTKIFYIIFTLYCF